MIEDIFRTAKRSDRRDYEVIVLSDHGQEESLIYEYEYGQTIEEAIKQSIESGPLGQRIVKRLDWTQADVHIDQRMRRLMRIQRGRIEPPSVTKEELADDVIITAQGPLGHIYYPVSVTDAIKADCAKDLVERRHVPLALYVTEDGTVQARNERGLWKLPDDIQEVLGQDHEFLEELKEDLVCLCKQPDSGDVLISGFHPDRRLVTFVQEYGAHADMGLEELRGFALVPRRFPIHQRETQSGESYIRGIDLYRAGMKFLGRFENSAHSGHEDGQSHPALHSSQAQTPKDRTHG